MGTSTFYEKCNRVFGNPFFIGMAAVLATIYLAKKGYAFGQWLQHALN